MARIIQGVFSWEDVLAQRYLSNKPTPLTKHRHRTSPDPKDADADAAAAAAAAVADEDADADANAETETDDLDAPQEAESSSSSLHHYHPQPTSSLLTKLSPELRLMIWERALGGRRLHVIQRCGRRLGHVVCSGLASCEVCRGGLAQPVRDGRCRCVWTGGGGNGSNGENGAGGGCGCDYLLALMLTCKQVYTESHKTLYTQNTLEFSNPWTLPYLLPTLRASTQHQIRSVELRYAFPGHWLPTKDPVKHVYVAAGRKQWIETCAAVRRLPALQSFRLALAGNWFCEGVEKIPVFLEPLRGLRLRLPLGGGGGGSGGDGGGGCYDRNNVAGKWVLVLPGQPFYVDEVDGIRDMLNSRGIECVVLVD